MQALAAEVVELEEKLLRLRSEQLRSTADGRAPGGAAAERLKGQVRALHAVPLNDAHP